MASNWELQLISSIVRGESPPDLFESAQKEGLSFRTFGGMEAKNLWATIDAHYRRPHNFGYIPSEEALTESFPSLDLPKPVENFLDLCGKVRDAHLRRETENAVQQYLSDVEPSKGLTTITELHQQLGQLLESSTAENDVCFSKVAFQETIDELRKIENSDGGITGIPWPWAKMNTATQGIQPGDYIMVWAIPKSMKTWFGLYVAAQVLQTGRRVLIYSKEMTWPVVRRRLACLLGGVNYTRLKNGTLSSAEQEQFLGKLEEICDPNFPGDVWFTQADRPDGGVGGPDEIRRKVDVFRPHFVMLDSSYMLELPGSGSNALDWKNLSIVNRRLKQIAKQTNVPILSILQENERAGIKYQKSRGTASLSSNSQAAMDCDVGIRLVYHKRKQELSLHLAAARETTVDGFTINAIAAENFSYAHDTLYNMSDVWEDEEKADQNIPDSISGEDDAPAPSPLMASQRERDELDDDLGI